VPLRSLALIRRWERDHPANARIQPLRDTLDDAPLAGRVPPFEQDHHLQLLVDDPVLQLDELALEAEELLEIESAIDPVRLRVILDLELELLVEEIQIQERLIHIGFPSAFCVGAMAPNVTFVSSDGDDLATMLIRSRRSVHVDVLAGANAAE